MLAPASALAISARASTGGSVSFIGATTVGRMVCRGAARVPAAVDGPEGVPAGAASAGGALGAGGCRRRGLGWRRVRGPACLGVDVGAPDAAALAPRAGDRARLAAEFRDHAAGAAAGHTLPRLMRLILAVILSACHVVMRLAFLG